MKEALLAETAIPAWVIDELAGDADDYIALLAQRRAKPPPN